ncbi:serine hydrolase domain-containing protein [Streptomyces sp. NRRL WC-3742]|uniref:serine hydrolase domain-containing protein n=1 Tax=Streptomyces sp. NRRL WC-3742 TaxID=1463934 RepID=UPI0004CC1660|nr:serine hydrolase domain-containing protein [Streptomyces sp. NRRL WC-3742]
MTVDRSRRPGVRLASAAVAAVAVTALAPAAVAAPPAPPGRTFGPPPELKALVEQGGGTAALAEVRDHGQVRWRAAAGVQDLVTRRPARADGRFRAGSVTKILVSTATLQLVAEGRIALDDRIEHYLPGVVPGGDGITVRQLLNHTSGLHDYSDDPRIRPRDDAGERAYLAAGRWVRYSPRKLVDMGTAMPPYFAPGQGFHYSNTNYVLVGMLIEQVTGRSWREEVRERILQPLGLRHTTLPATSTGIPGPHAHAYVQLPEGPADITRISPTVADAAGAAVSTTADLNRFHAALFGGRLLAPAQLAEMTTTADVPGSKDEYGLGVTRYQLSCGVAWGHIGDMPGYSTALLGTADGSRQLALSVTEYDRSDPERTDRLYQALVDNALCKDAPN